MSARLIDGKAFAEALRRKIGTYAREFEAAAGRKAGLAVVLVGEDPASEVYIRSKSQAMVAAGMDSFEYRLAADAGEAALLAKVEQLNADPKVDGILVQLPLPEGFHEDRVISAIDPDKDVDGFNVVNAGRLAVGEKGIVPCTPLGCMALLKDCCGDLAGMEAVVIGRSNIVGRPMAQLLTRADATVTVAHSRTKNLAEVVKRADIVVAAAGRAELVKGEWIKPGAVVIDVGINRVTRPDGSARLAGDVDFAAAREVAGAITPVPGGVGPMTIAMLLRNTLVSACHREGIPIDEDAL